MATLIAWAIAGAAAIHHFGWIDGIGLTCALFALSPYPVAS